MVKNRLSFGTEIDAYLIRVTLNLHAYVPLVIFSRSTHGFFIITNVNNVRLKSKRHINGSCRFFHKEQRDPLCYTRRVVLKKLYLKISRFIVSTKEKPERQEKSTTNKTLLVVSFGQSQHSNKI